MFHDRSDHTAFLNILGSVCERFEWNCLAYVMMEDHYHLLVQTTKANLSRGMRQLNGVYTQNYNRTHESNGNVFHGRFKAILVDQENLLAQTYSHIVNNPVALKKSRKADAYAWSSYGATIGKKKAPKWLAVSELLSHFGKRPASATKALVKAVEGGKGDSTLWNNLQKQIFLGDDAFVKDMLRLNSNENATVKSRKPKKPKALKTFLKGIEDRNQAIFTAYSSGLYTMDQIGKHFDIHYATVSRIVKKMEQAAKK